MPIIENAVGKNGGYNTPEAMKSLITYTLNPDKAEIAVNVFPLGFLPDDEITAKMVCDSFMEDKIRFDKTDGRQCFHTIISWHPDELDHTDPADQQIAMQYALDFCERINPGCKAIISIHTNKDHLHAHIVWNSVSAVDGKKINERRGNLYEKRKVNDELSKQYGFRIVEKGKHYDGRDIEEGTIRVSSSYEQSLINTSPEKSFMLDLAEAVGKAKTNATSREEFISIMDESGWTTVWEDSRKIILFINKETGKKVRNTTLGKRFSLNIGKEDLENDFKANYCRETESVQRTDKLPQQGRIDENNRRASDPDRGTSGRKRRRRNRKPKIDESSRKAGKRNSSTSPDREATQTTLQSANRVIKDHRKTIYGSQPTLTDEEIDAAIGSIAKKVEENEPKSQKKNLELQNQYSYSLLSLLIDAMTYSHSISGFVRYLFRNFWRCFEENGEYKYQHRTTQVTFSTKDFTNIYHVDLSKAKIKEIVEANEQSKAAQLIPYKEIRDKLGNQKDWTTPNLKPERSNDIYKEQEYEK